MALDILVILVERYIKERSCPVKAGAALRGVERYLNVLFHWGFRVEAKSITSLKHQLWYENKDLGLFLVLDCSLIL